MHSTHFIYGYMASDIYGKGPFWQREEGKKEMFLFNDALNKLYLRLYGVSHIVKYHSDSEKENPLPPLHGLLFPITSKGSFFIPHPTDRIVYTTASVTPVVKHWLVREIAQWVLHEGSIRRSIAPWANALPQSYISLEQCINSKNVVPASAPRLV